jgi:protein TonB
MGGSSGLSHCQGGGTRLRRGALMTALERTYPDRLKAGLPALAVHLLIGLALVRGLGVDLAGMPPAVMKLINLQAPPPPPPIVARPKLSERSRRREGAASPPNLESRHTEIVAPPTTLPVLSPVVAAPTADTGADPTAGSAQVVGPGTGSGGLGTGTGSGRYGDGPGGGGDGDGDGGGYTPPRRIRGSISGADYPSGVGEAGVAGTVSVIYTVETDGRATRCEITASSGSPELDETTCRLIERRFRFRPSLDGHGRPVRSRIVQDHVWEVQDDPEAPDERPRRRRPW